jgi:hypothetical protein
MDFTKISNPQSTKPTSSVSIYIKDSTNNPIAEVTTGIQYIATYGSLQTTPVMTATPTVIGSTSSLTVTFKPSSKITTSSALRVTFPSEISFPGTTCALSNLSEIQASATCSVSGQILRIITPFGSDYIPSSSGNIQFTMQNITMPGTTAPTGTFSIESIHVDSSVDYVIDKSSYSNLLVSSAGQITTASVSPDPQSAYSLAIYTISFTASHDIVQNGKIKVTFPSEISIPNPADSANNNCTAVSGIEAGYSCSATSSTLIITSGFTSAALNAGSTVSFRLGGVRNPVSLQVTSSFTIETLTSDDFNIDSINSGVTTTMTIVNQMSSVQILPESLVNSDVNNIRFKIVASSPLQKGDLIKITFPSQVSAPSGTISCSGITALSTTISCTKPSTSPEIIQVVFNFGTSTEIAANELMEFSINSCTNPPTTQTTDTFTFLIQNTNEFNINNYLGKCES